MANDPRLEIKGRGVKEHLPTVLIDDAAAERQFGQPMVFGPGYGLSNEYYPAKDGTQVVTGQPASPDIADVVINAINFCINQADLARKPHRALWDNMWRLYNNEWDWSDKEDWQSQRDLPKVTLTVERQAATFLRILSLAKNWLKAESEAPSLQKYLDLARDWLLHNLTSMDPHFMVTLYRAWKVALLTGNMPIMVAGKVEGAWAPEFTPPPGTVSNDSGQPVSAWPTLFSKQTEAAPDEPEPDAPEWKLWIKELNPDRILKDPTSRKRWLAYEYEYTKGEFLAEAEENAWVNVDVVLRENFPQVDRIARDAEKKQSPPVGHEGDLVHITVFWGDLYDQYGNRIWKNHYCVVANKRHVVSPPAPNPFWHKQIPIVCEGLLDVPFAVWHKSLIGISADSIELWVEFLNMVVDYFQAIFIGQYEIDMSQIHDSEDVELKWYPGKLWKKKGAVAGQNSPLITFVQPGQVDPQVWQFMETLRGEVVDNTAMQDATAGPPIGRGKTSPAEYTKRLAAAGALIDAIYQNIEKTTIGPILKMAYQVLLQYTPQQKWANWLELRKDKYPDLAGEIEALKKLTPQQRYKLLASEINFSPRIFSAVFDRQDEIEKVTFALGVIGQIPQAAAHTKWENILSKLIEAFGWDQAEMISREPRTYPFMFPDAKGPASPNAPPQPPAQAGAPPQGGPSSDGGDGIPTQPPPAGASGAGGFVQGVVGGVGDRSISSLFDGLRAL